MEKSKINRKLVYSFVLILGIHSLVQILSSALEFPLSIFVEYEYLPWTRIIGLAIELVLTTILLNRIKKGKHFAFDNKKMIFLILLSAILFIGTYFKVQLEVPLTFCATGDYDSYIQELSSKHSKQWFIVNIIVAITMGLYILTTSLISLKSND